MIKRLFDIVLSLTGLIIFSPVMFLCAVWIKLSSPGPIIFQQTRVGKNFEPFRILKFRSMKVDNDGAKVTVDGDSRITTAGRILRKTKLDELPQLFNVLRGDMSFVGPRPEVPEYVEMFKEDYADLLKIRPGILGLSTIVFRYEEEILAAADDPGKAYISEILPAKIKLAREYIERSSVAYDIKLIIITFLRIFGLAGDPKPGKT